MMTRLLMLLLSLFLLISLVACNSSKESTPNSTETTVPGDETTASGDETTVPGDETTVPGDETTASGDETTVPGDETTDSDGAEITPHEHVWGDWSTVTPATCEDDGEEMRECVNCDHSETRTLGALGHDEILHDAKPACVEIGWDAYVACSRCEYTTCVEKPIQGHDYDQVWKCTACSHALTVSEGLRYELNEDGESYSVFKGTCTDADVVIPYTYENLPVTSIGNNAFYGCTSLTEIKIPNGVESIGNHAFYITSLTEIEIPNGVESIGDNAFCNCTRLESVVIGNGVESIGNYAFYGCIRLTEIEISNGVESIGDSVFSGCSGLAKIEIPDGVESIGNYAFYRCTSLESVVIGNGVESIGEYAFRGCSSLTSVYYSGTVSDWNEISIGSSNNPLTNATRYYYSEIEPTTTGNYWHYVDGVPTAW